jgi:hypothetical protein
MTRSIGLLAIVVVLVASCAPAQTPQPKLTLNGVEMTQAEFQYGRDVAPDDTVKLASDVVLVPNGSRAIRSVTGDGMTWTLDPKAPGIDQLQAGKVMFLTGQAMGRIVDVRSSEAGTLVTVAPVDITEVITDGSFSGTDEALDASQLIAYDTGPQPWSVTSLAPSPSPSGTATPAPSSAEPAPSPEGVVVRLASYRDPGASARDASPLDNDQEYQPGDISQRPPPPFPSWGGPPSTSVGDYHIDGLCCDGGVGVKVDRVARGVGVHARLMITGTKPSVTWHLEIAGAKVTRAGLTVHGMAGINYAFRINSDAGLGGNFHDRMEVPLRLSWTIPVAHGIPFTISISQSFIVASAMSSMGSFLHAAGTWTFDGELGFEYGGGDTVNPNAMGRGYIKQSMLNNLEGFSEAPAGIVLAHRVETRVGIGTGSFAVGPFIDVVSSVGASKGSNIGLLICRGVDLNIAVGAGISYKLPNIVVRIVNMVLKLLDAKPVENEGIITRGEYQVVHKSVTRPDVKLCH